MTNRFKEHEEQEKVEKDPVMKEENHDEVIIDEEDIEFVNEENSENETLDITSKEDVEIKKLQEEQVELQNRILRVQADFENFKRRTNEEKINDRKYRSQKLVEDLLPILDNFKRALDIKTENEEVNALKQGMEMVSRQLTDALQKEGVKEIDAQGTSFDPNLHQAVTQEESDDHEPNVVIEVFQSGYTLNERVIRPAMVKVSS